MHEIKNEGDFLYIMSGNLIRKKFAELQSRVIYDTDKIFQLLCMIVDLIDRYGI
jgi:hypothetical protein